MALRLGGFSMRPGEHPRLPTKFMRKGDGSGQLGPPRGPRPATKGGGRARLASSFIVAGQRRFPHESPCRAIELVPPFLICRGGTGPGAPRRGRQFLCVALRSLSTILSHAQTGTWGKRGKIVSASLQRGFSSRRGAAGLASVRPYNGHLAAPMVGGRYGRADDRGGGDGRCGCAKKSRPTESAETRKNSGFMVRRCL